MDRAQRCAFIRCWWALCLLVALALSALPRASDAAGSFIAKTYNGHSYNVFLPSGYQPGTAIPLVVMLHGCTQDPDQFAMATAMNDVAEQHTFIAVYPEQSAAANANKCWNWFKPAHQARGSGEPALLAGIAEQVTRDYTVDEQRVYVAGLSAGAAMSVIMGATYPDIFAAVGVGSGLEYQAATTTLGAFKAMARGGPNPERKGNRAYSAMGSQTRGVPVIAFHGTADTTVALVNSHQVIAQWAQTNDRADDGADNNSIDNTPDATTMDTVPGGHSFTRYVYQDASGADMLEKYIVDGMGHAWSGGSSAAPYTDPQGPNASQLMWQFFAAHPRG